MSESPALLVYEGEGMFAPANRAVAQRADRDFVIGERYLMVAEDERSQKSHNQLFAWVAERWQTLPDRLALEFPTADRLRYRALVETGWHRERRLIASSTNEARKIAAFMGLDAPDNTFISVVGPALVLRTARSMKTRGNDRMNKAEFQQAKQNVMDWIDDLLGITDTPSISPARPPVSGERADPPPDTRSTNPANDRRRAAPVREVA
jgi:hypothetical protein